MLFQPLRDNGGLGTRTILCLRAHRENCIMRRIGYVGLSTPIYYDYKYMASQAPSDDSSSPNPILEGAFGALLLYDELWFLCRSLCPENMRQLRYVKFLDEAGDAPDIDPKWLQDPEDVFSAEALSDFAESSSSYKKVKDQAHIHWKSATDNHTHELIIGNQRLSGNSWSARNVVFDTLVVERLPLKVELITNSFSSRLFKTEMSTGKKLQLTESLVLNDVPQFISPAGPYHACVEEVRNSPYLTSFRDWITKEAFTANQTEVNEMKREVESNLAEAQKQVFLKYLHPAGSYKSFAETVIGAGVDSLIPGVAAVKDLFGQRNEEKKKQALRWQGFILDARSRIGCS
jgi:hypothetical protein